MAARLRMEGFKQKIKLTHDKNLVKRSLHIGTGVKED